MKKVCSGQIWGTKPCNKLNFYLLLFVVESLKLLFVVELWSFFWWILLEKVTRIKSSCCYKIPQCFLKRALNLNDSKAVSAAKCLNQISNCVLVTDSWHVRHSRNLIPFYISHRILKYIKYQKLTQVLVIWVMLIFIKVILERHIFIFPRVWLMATFYCSVILFIVTSGRSVESSL